MWKKIGYTALVVLATLGVLFIVVMLMPEPKEEKTETAEAIESETQKDAPSEEEEEPEETELPEQETETKEEAAAKEEETTSAGAAAVQIPSDELSEKTLTFQTTTLDGEKVTNEIFSDYDITVVHVWGTYCGPCIEEMPEVAAYYRELPANINMVGLLVDVYDGIETNEEAAWEILNDAGAEFMNLRTSDTLYDILGQIQFVPTSFLVDKEGHLIGRILEGVPFQDVMERVEEYIR